MNIRFALIAAALSPTAAFALPGGNQQAQALVEAAKRHLHVFDLKRSTATSHGTAHNNMTEVSYDDPVRGRFITYYLAPDGALKEFVVNGPGADPYVPINDRRAFIARMMAIVAPGSSKAERDWGSNALDAPWSQRIRPLSVQVGPYVFRGMTVGRRGQHDTFSIVSEDMGYQGLKYRAPK